MAEDGLGRSAQFATRAIHVGQELEPATGSITVPIYQTSTFAQMPTGIHKGYTRGATIRRVWRSGQRS
jgi:cystathionine beta-lyase/cystathionine gamma-synthase